MDAAAHACRNLIRRAGMQTYRQGGIQASVHEGGQTRMQAGMHDREEEHSVVRGDYEADMQADMQAYTDICGKACRQA